MLVYRTARKLSELNDDDVNAIALMAVSLLTRHKVFTPEYKLIEDTKSWDDYEKYGSHVDEWGVESTIHTNIVHLPEIDDDTLTKVAKSMNKIFGTINLPIGVPHRCTDCAFVDIMVPPLNHNGEYKVNGKNIPIVGKNDNSIFTIVNPDIDYIYKCRANGTVHRQLSTIFICESRYIDDIERLDHGMISSFTKYKDVIQLNHTIKIGAVYISCHIIEYFTIDIRQRYGNEYRNIEGVNLSQLTYMAWQDIAGNVVPCDPNMYNSFNVMLKTDTITYHSRTRCDICVACHTPLYDDIYALKGMYNKYVLVCGKCIPDISIESDTLFTIHRTLYPRHLYEVIENWHPDSKVTDAVMMMVLKMSAAVIYSKTGVRVITDILDLYHNMVTNDTSKILYMVD